MCLTQQARKASVISTTLIHEGDRQMGNLENTLWKLDLIKQAVIGIAQRGAQGDIQSVDDETLGVERLIREVRADLERAIAGSVARHEARLVGV
jgi:hypothetical protein